MLFRSSRGANRGKTLLLDQRTVAGLGNIYVCEALHRAGVSPKKRAGAIGRDRLEALASEIRKVIEEAIEATQATALDPAAIFTPSPTFDAAMAAFTLSAASTSSRCMSSGIFPVSVTLKLRRRSPEDRCLDLIEPRGVARDFVNSIVR